ncbi:MAG: hypothetical protein PF517_10865 [Salinivirgaceae bacterium]|nr:hypothetical protein [Salinivirgaceae bacterium]
MVNEVIELLSDVALKKEITLVNNIDDNIKVYANLYMISTVVGI